MPGCRIWIVAVALLGCGLAVPAVRSAEKPATPREFVFQYDHVIGTSLDLYVTADDPQDAGRAEQVVLDEIDRLQRVFSTYDPNSEISRLNRATGTVPASAELREVLHAYDHWQRKSGGAFNGQLGSLIRVWQDAGKADREPDPVTLARLVEQVRRPGWTIDDRAGTVTRLTDQPLNLNSIAKGTILSKAAAAVKTRLPGVRGVLLNLGGDMAAWGRTADGFDHWTVGVQDPLRPEENAPPLAGIHLKDSALASSGGYQRFVTIGGRRYSHLLDPRTGRPAGAMAGATVLAGDNVTANALATTLCVLSPAEGLKLVESTPGAECLIVAATGEQFRSKGMPAFALTAFRPDDANEEPKAQGDPWPEGFQVSFALELPRIDGGRRYRRPYVAVWIDDASGKTLRTVAMWGNQPRWLRTMTDWWRVAGGDSERVRAVTRATRGPGKYELVWDGKDDQGNPLPQGTYTVRIEVNREHGRHTRQSGKIECGKDGAKLTLEKNAEIMETQVEYGKKKK